MRSAMRHVRAEDGMELIKNGAAVLYKLTATVHGFLSVRAILGRSAGIPGSDAHRATAQLVEGAVLG
jgi:hypothetical protein